MGKGDKRSRRGKIFKSSYGNTRPRLKNTPKGRAINKAKKTPSKTSK